MKTIIISILILVVITVGGWYLFFREEKNINDEVNAQSPEAGQAAVDSISLELITSDPIRMRVTAKGNLNDSCTHIDDTSTSQVGNTFNVSIATERETDASCAQVLVPFEKIIDIEVSGLALGTYTVNVNGVTDTFELKVDQKL